MSVSYRNKYIPHTIMSFRRTSTLGSQGYRQESFNMKGIQRHLLYISYGVLQAAVILHPAYFKLAADATIPTHIGQITVHWGHFLLIIHTVNSEEKNMEANF